MSQETTENNLASDDRRTVLVNLLRARLQYFNEELGQFINATDRYKLGQVLTIIDAAIADPEQRKAIKDLVNNAFWGFSNVRQGETAMTNPHVDLRALCESLGFSLYEQKTAESLSEPYQENLSYEIKRYNNAK